VNYLNSFPSYWSVECLTENDVRTWPRQVWDDYLGIYRTQRGKSRMRWKRIVGWG